ncbi:oleandomycin transport system permease protein [Mumia flava]|uniref:Transport permease protein n=1 Tax=Mumia flava TaxID=1348852 RepID=A0A0B2B267_9ACTN|nr:ABC transporter permease [Mumia flava]PJJ58430.1 oleandomycin transport system permease protein [Mumia flava]
MTTLTAVPGRTAPRPLPLVRHGLVLARRSISTIVRTPEQLIDVTLQPILFTLVFVYLFGGAISGSTHDYLQFVLPGLMVQTVLLSTVSIGVNMNDDIKEGLFDRFRSLPIPRSAPLVGAVLAEGVRYSTSIVVTLAFGYVIGFRADTNPASVVAGMLLVLLFAWALCWVSVFLGMIVRQSGAVQGIAFLVLFPLTFGSSMFVDPDTLPGWLQAFVNVNPLSSLTDAVRGLFTGGAAVSDIAVSLGGAALIMAVFAPLAVGAYRRKA